MERRTGRPRTDDERLNVDRILTVALEIIDREGMAGLTMRRLGKELDVDPMAIYYHLPNKQAVIRGMVQRVFEEIAELNTRQPPSDWKDGVRSWALRYRAAAAQHASLFVHLVADASAWTEGVMNVNEQLYTALNSSGMAPRDVVRSADMIVDYVHGVILGLGLHPAPVGDPRDVFRNHLQGSSPDRLQTIRTVFQSLEAEELAVDFEFGLEVIIAGLEQTLFRSTPQRG